MSQLKKLPRTGFTRANELVDFLPIGLSTLWKWSKDGRFPPPIKISNKVTAWDNREVWMWFEKNGAEPAEIPSADNHPVRQHTPQRYADGKQSTQLGEINFTDWQKLHKYVQQSDFSLAEEAELASNSFKYKNIIGVYFLIKDSKVVYIGQSINIVNRISTHANNHDFDSVAIIECCQEELDVLESLYIFKFQTPLNGSFKSSKHPHARHTPITLKKCIQILKEVPK